MILLSIWLIRGKAKRERSSAESITHATDARIAMIACRGRKLALATGSERSMGSELEIDECIGLTRRECHHHDSHDYACGNRHRKVSLLKNVFFPVRFQAVIDQNHDAGNGGEKEQFGAVLTLPAKIGGVSQHLQCCREGSRPKENPAHADNR